MPWKFRSMESRDLSTCTSPQPSVFGNSQSKINLLFVRGLLEDHLDRQHFGRRERGMDGEKNGGRDIELGGRLGRVRGGRKGDCGEEICGRRLN
mmetsp:Transcript_6755/g.19123  ORF Transcript_6755/g.19123 Transcript_6755/m.19123 type:complete len:94 (-) Transcript_6755:29-310(-)